MGLFDKLKNMAAKKAVEALDSAKQKIQEQAPLTTAPKPAAAPVPPPVSAAPAAPVSAGYPAEEEAYDGYMSYDEYERNECSDSDLEELTEAIDEAIYDDDIDDEDTLDDIYEIGEDADVSADEIDELISLRIKELKEATNSGIPRKIAYRTRSVWKRCPDCGRIVPGNFMFCSCGYQVRHKVVTAVAASYLKQGKLPTAAEMKRIGIDTLRDKTCSRMGITRNQADSAVRAAGNAVDRLSSRLNPDSSAGQAAARAKSLLSGSASSSRSSSSSRKSSSSSSSLLRSKKSSSHKSGLGLGFGKKRR